MPIVYDIRIDRSGDQPPSDNDEIVRLFREWRTIWAAADLYAARSKPMADDDPSYLGLVGRADDLLNEISQIPAAGVVGLSLKLYLTVRELTGGGLNWNHAAICNGADTSDICKTVLADAIRFAPQLEPLFTASNQTPDRRACR